MDIHGTNNIAVDVSGEFVRDDNTEDQEGIFLGIDTQVIDVETCDPVPELYVEIWRTSTPIPISIPVIVRN